MLIIEIFKYTGLLPESYVIKIQSLSKLTAAVADSKNVSSRHIISSVLHDLDFHLRKNEKEALSLLKPDARKSFTALLHKYNEVSDEAHLRNLLIDSKVFLSETYHGRSWIQMCLMKDGIGMLFYL
jgi:hypothetical protein